MKNIMIKIFTNSWIKTIYFLLICVGLTYIVVTNFSTVFLSFFDLKKKSTWANIAIIIPIIFMIPMFLHSFFFMKVIEIADNTKKQNRLIEKQNQLLEQLLQKTLKN